MSDERDNTICYTLYLDFNAKLKGETHEKEVLNTSDNAVRFSSTRER